MAKAIPIESCSKCTYWDTTPYPTADSFERPDYWWCKHPDVEDKPCKHEDDEKRRQNMLNARSFADRNRMQYTHLRLIAAYVEWNDKTPIPKFCPLKDI